LRRLPVDTETDQEQWPLDESKTEEWDIKVLPTIDMSTFSQIGAQGSTYYTTSTGYNYGNITIGTSPYVYTTNNTGLHVTSDAEFGGDIKWKGRSLSTLLEKIEDRLAILPDPDPEKLKKFAALKKAYDQYKLMEKLIGDDWKDKDK